ncbi:MAG: hypothetical protein ACI4KI_02130 [Candidatus Fimenecus sp.]
MKKTTTYLILFIAGGIGYGLIEILFRGYTHWSMIITGGSALLSLYLINEALKCTSIFIRAAAGSATITLLELTVGIIVNRIFLLDVWDYSDVPLNLFGQISLPFSICWYFLSIIVFLVFDIKDKLLYRRHSENLNAV